MSRDREDVVRNTRHVTPDILAPIVDARVLKSEEGGLNEFASAEVHGTRIFGRDSKFQEVELIQIFEECSGAS